MKIIDIRATTVTVPLEAPLRHANGCHWGRFVRTVIEVETDEGLVGLGEMGVQLATMLHLGTVIPNLSFAADAHYHHLSDDIIEGGPFKYEGGSIRVPTGPGLGVRLDRDKLAEYAEAYKRLGGYPYDQDPLRPAWTPTIPNNRWADPNDSHLPTGVGF
jgi:L-alanine-DL-glutamate epimerase-like enolase superfamily enzyme